MLGLLGKTGMLSHHTAQPGELQFADFQQLTDFFCLDRVALVTIGQDSLMKTAEN
jgi:hypothetical protein